MGQGLDQIILPGGGVGLLIPGEGPALTILSGVLTPTHSLHAINPESGASDTVTDIDTKNMIQGIDECTFYLADDTDTITFSDGAGNFRTLDSADIVLILTSELFAHFVWTGDFLLATLFPNSSLGGGGNKFFWSRWESGGNNGDYRGKNIGPSANFRNTFIIPPDFGTLVSLENYGIPDSTFVSKNINHDSDYGGNGQGKTEHSESDAAHVVSGTIDTHFTDDISGVFSSLAAGDRCGFMATHVSLGASIFYLFIFGVYTPA